LLGEWIAIPIFLSLNGLATLCIEKKLLDDVNIEAIIDDFASRNVRRHF
jgi:hypothetical protein